MASIELRGITKRFASNAAVDDVSIRIDDGEFLTLLGPSGCGKSTLLNIVAGLLPADDGALLIDGTDVTNLAPKDRGVAMVFQDYALYPHMTVAQNLAFPLRAVSTPAAEIRENVAAAAATLGITDLLDRLPKALSGGQRQRVALGRAIVRRPRVFLMDEPLSNLDAKLRIQMRAELKLLSKRLRTTTIYVTHDQSEAMTLSDRVAILHDGKLQQVDRPIAVYERPLNTFVANFMGAMPMNLISGVIERHADGGASFSHPPVTFEIPWALASGHAILGIRPEDVVVASHLGENSFPMSVEIIENLGADAYVYLVGADVRIVARVHPTFDPSDEVFVRIDPAKVRFFDPDSGNALSERETVNAPR